MISSVAPQERLCIPRPSITGSPLRGLCSDGGRALLEMGRPYGACVIRGVYVARDGSPLRGFLTEQRRSFERLRNIS